MEDVTDTASKTLTDGGSSKEAKYLMLPKMLVADLKARELLASRAIKRRRTPRKTGKSWTSK